MLSARLVRLIQDHAEDLTGEVLRDLRSNPRTQAYHALPLEEVRRRVYDVCHNFGRWLGDKTEAPVEATYGALGRTRRAEGVPLSEVVYALMLTKQHLRGYIMSAGLVGSAVDLYQEEELSLLTERFFDRAVYHAVKGYEAGVTAADVARSR